MPHCIGSQMDNPVIEHNNFQAKKKDFCLSDRGLLKLAMINIKI
jgi:hypothetical protein